MGSKAKLVGDLTPILTHNRESRPFVDLFCGGCSIAQNVGGVVTANDNNKFLIAMFKGLQLNEERPHRIDRGLYDKARDEYRGRVKQTLSDFLIGWIGWMGSYNGRFFDGGYAGHNVNGRDYISEQIRNTERQVVLIKDIEFTCLDYREFQFTSPSVIYCDIPYQGTKQYDSSKEFNHHTFWQWCRSKKDDGHTVYISEYTAPEDFHCIWSKQVTNSLGTFTTHKPIERLFTPCAYVADQWGKHILTK